MNEAQDAVDPGWTEVVRRVVWITIQLILVYCLAEESRPFFYQAF
jgi:hypothetical protein